MVAVGISGCGTCLGDGATICVLLPEKYSTQIDPKSISTLGLIYSEVCENRELREYQMPRILTCLTSWYKVENMRDKSLGFTFFDQYRSDP